VKQKQEQEDSTMKKRVVILAIYLVLCLSLLPYGMQWPPEKPTLVHNLVSIKVKSVGGRIGRGTGLIVSENLDFVTDYHVILGACEVWIFPQFAPGESLQAVVVDSLPEKDVALLRVSSSKKVPGFKPLTFLCPIDDKLFGRDVSILVDMLMSRNIAGIISAVFPESLLVCTDTTLVTGTSGSPVTLSFLRQEVVIGLVKSGVTVKRGKHPLYGDTLIARPQFGIIPACCITSLLKKHSSIRFKEKALTDLMCICHKHSNHKIR
jgi:hypothetical protein